MIHNLTEQDAGKVMNLKDVAVVAVPETAPTGTVFILFNNSDKFATIQRLGGSTYVSASNTKKTHIEFPPRCMANVVFVDEETAVISRALS